MGVRTEVLEILIRAHDEASRELAKVAAEADKTGNHVRAVGASVRVGLMATGAAAAGILAIAVDEAAKYQTMMQHVQSNTGMTDADMKQMSKGILKMSADTGAPLKQLADGFMHIHNFGFSAAESMKILRPAMESALSTGDDVGKVASALGVAMHEFHINADQARTSMNLLHVAAQEGNATLGEFVDGTTRAFNVAGGFGVKLQDISAALSTLTQSGQTARAASDGMSSAMFSIVKPTSAATSMINLLSHQTGVNLVQDFSAAGLKARGLTNVIIDVRNAVNKMGGETATQRKTLLDYAAQLEKNNVTGDKFVTKMTAMAKSIGDPTQALLALFPNVRAFREMMLLTGSQADSFATHVSDMANVVSGKVDPTLAGFIRQQNTLEGQSKKVDAQLRVIAITLGTAMIPALTKMLQASMPVIQAVSDWIQKNPQLTVVILASVTALGALAAILPAITVALGAAEIAVVALTGPVGLLIVGIGALAVAWNSDWMGMRTDVENAVKFMNPYFKQVNDFLHPVAMHLGLGTGLGDQVLNDARTAMSKKGKMITPDGKVVDIPGWHKAGKDVVDGLSAGMTLAQEKVYAAAHHMSLKAVQAAVDTFQTHSPSRVFFAIGQNVGQGFIDGLTGTQAMIAATATKAAKGAIDAADYWVKPYTNKKGHVVPGHWADRAGDAARERAGLVPIGGPAAKSAVDALDYWVGPHMRRNGTVVAGHWADRSGDAARERAGLAPIGGASAVGTVATALVAQFGAAVAKAVTATAQGLATAGNASTLTHAAASAQKRGLADMARAHYDYQRASIDHGQRSREDLKRMGQQLAKAHKETILAGVLAGYAVQADVQNKLDPSSAIAIANWSRTVGGAMQTGTQRAMAMSLAAKARGVPLSVAATAGYFPSTSPTYSMPGGSSGGGSYSGGGSTGETINITVNIQPGGVALEIGGDAAGRVIAKDVSKAIIDALHSSQFRTAPGPRSGLPGAS